MRKQIKSVFIGALTAVVLVGCGGGSSDSAGQTAVKYDLWNYLIPVYNKTSIYDIVIYDENDTITSSLYGYTDVVYEYINDNEVHETTRSRSTYVTYKRLENTILIDSKEETRFVQNGDTFNDCVITLGDNNISTLCSYGSVTKNMVYKKYVGLTEEVLQDSSSKFVTTLSN